MTAGAGAWIVPALAALIVLGVLAWLARRGRRWFDQRLRGAARRTIRRFELRLERHKLTSRRLVRQRLLDDPAVRTALADYCRAQRVSPIEARARVEQYIDEIVPFFNILSYYRFGYPSARWVLRALYRISSEYQDRAALEAIPRNDVVVYLMNHRSNVDYVVVAFVLARAVSISYAVGEWARIWPLEYVLKSFGAYFVRRQYREPLYHAVLERYIQSITKNGVTQGIFLEGRLSRNGALQPPKVGLLDYLCRTMLDPAFDRDVWFVPVALNYDRVLEDRVLIHELLDEDSRPGRLRQLASLTRYTLINLLRLLTGRLDRYGRVAVNFGTPLSLSHWLQEHPGTLNLPRPERRAALDRLAREVLRRIATIMPAPPVPVLAAALLSFQSSWVARQALLERLEEIRDHLLTIGAKLVPPSATPDEILDRAWPTLALRRLAVREAHGFVVLPRQRPLLEFYANSIQHLLPSWAPHGGHPALEPEGGLPALRGGRAQEGLWKLGSD